MLQWKRVNQELCYFRLFDMFVAEPLNPKSTLICLSSELKLVKPKTRAANARMNSVLFAIFFTSVSLVIRLDYQSGTVAD